MRTTVSRSDPRSLRFTQVHEDDDGRYRLTEVHLTDPRRDAYVVRVRLESLDGGDYQVLVDYDPALDNSGMDDRARGHGKALLATDGEVSTALMAEPALTGLRSGLKGERLSKKSAGPGNVVQRARISRDHRAAGTPGRDADARPGRHLAERAHRGEGIAHQHLEQAPDVVRRRLAPLSRPAQGGAGEREQRARHLPRVGARAGRGGGQAATPARSWPRRRRPGCGATRSRTCRRRQAPITWCGRATPTSSAPRCGRPATSERARRIVDWLFEVQQKKDGSFPQNSDVTGKPVWSELQLDEVALPIVLAHLTGRTGPRTWPGVRKAASFLVRFKDEETGLRAPFSPQERWENQSGFSPNSIAAQINGLVSAADIARKQRPRPPDGEVAGHRRPLAGQARALDGHHERPAQRAPLLPAAEQGRQARAGRRRTAWATAARA